MAAGDGKLGASPAGYDLLVGTEALRRALPHALYLDGATADFPLDSDGLHRSLHPNDQWVALQLLVRQGTMRSVPGMGNRLREITRVAPARAQRLAEDYINQALSDRVRTGDIRINSVEVDTSVRGRLVVAVSYTNMRLLPLRPTTLRVI